MTTVYLGLGSNDAPEVNLPRGVALIAAQYRLLAVSPVYQSAATQGGEAAPYANAVIAIACEADYATLKAALVAIEDACGRVRLDALGRKSRVVAFDSDILLMGEAIVSIGRWQVPHPDTLEQAYTVIPLAEIAPDLLHPTAQAPMQTIARRFNPADLQRLPWVLGA